MDKKKLVLLLGALVVAIGSAFLARSMFAGDAAPVAEAAAPEPEGPKVLVANRALPAGTIITADAMGYQAWPEELVQDAYFIEGESDMSQLLGTVVRFPVTAGEPVTQGSLVRPGDRGFLAAALGPGMRAVTVPVSATTGVGGFIFPGDRVDLVLTQTFTAGRGDIDGGETILTNLRVLATDQSTETVTDEEGKTVVRAFRTVTFEVTPEYAEMISVAQSMGSLSLALRSLSDSQAELERAIASGDVSIPANATPEEEERILRSAMSRPTRGAKRHITANDISSFYRANAPAEQNNGRSSQTPASPGVAATTNGAPTYTGPSVRVTRGKATTEVPVGGSVSTAVAPGAGSTIR
ncbi:MAG: Flp pilus assembly protein CpaB [Pseudomonadota bacterium]